MLLTLQKRLGKMQVLLKATCIEAHRENFNEGQLLRQCSMAAKRRRGGLHPIFGSVRGLYLLRPSVYNLNDL